MTDMLTEMAKSAPGLVVALLIVFLFLKERRESMEQIRADRKDMTDAFQKMHEDNGHRAERCHEVQMKTSLALERFTEKQTQVVEAIQEVKVAVERNGG